MTGWINSGGPVMWLILVCGFIALVIFLVLILKKKKKTAH